MLGAFVEGILKVPSDNAAFFVASYEAPMSPATRRREVTIDALGKAEPSFGLTKLRRQRFQRALLYRAQEGGQSAGESTRPRETAAQSR